MSILSIFKDLKNNLITNKLHQKKVEKLYNAIDDIMADYRKNYLKEVLELAKNNHKHYLMEETENKILDLISIDESVLRYQDILGRNLGMDAIDLGLEKVIIKSLQDEIASTQQDKLGMNMGMYCARNHLEKATLKSLKNKQSRRQINKDFLSIYYEIENSNLTNLFDVANDRFRL